MITENKLIKVVRLPTEDKTNIKLDPDGIRLWYDNIPISTEVHKHQHIYVTVSQDREPIKEGDWYIDDCNTLRQSITNDKDYWEARQDYRKIIATNNPKLLKEHDDTVPYLKMRNTSVAQLQQSFLKEFVANPDGEYEVEYEDISYYQEDTHPTQDNGRWVEKFKLKLNQDNTINITYVKEKMYSREEMVVFGKNCAEVGYENELDNEGQLTKDWINENLPKEVKKADEWIYWDKED
jgi:hypothetical protein